MKYFIRTWLLIKLRKPWNPFKFLNSLILSYIWYIAMMRYRVRQPSEHTVYISFLESSIKMRFFLHIILWQDKLLPCSFYQTLIHHSRHKPTFINRITWLPTSSVYTTSFGYEKFMCVFLCRCGRLWLVLWNNTWDVGRYVDNFLTENSALVHRVHIHVVRTLEGLSKLIGIT